MPWYAPSQSNPGPESSVSRQLRRADYLHTTVHHLEPDGAAAMRFLELAQRLWDTQPTSPRPLGDEALEAFCRRAAEQEVEGLA